MANSWCAGLKVQRAQAGLGAIPGLFELWLREKGAALMGSSAAARWSQMVLSGMQPPLPSCHFSLDGENFELEDSVSRGRHYTLSRGKCPVVAAWAALAWGAVLEEVHIRFGDEHKLTVAVDSAAGQGTVDLATGQGTVDSDSATGQGAEVAVANSAGSSNNKDNRSFHSFRSLKFVFFLSRCVQGL